MNNANMLNIELTLIVPDSVDDDEKMAKFAQGAVEDIARLLRDETELDVPAARVGMTLMIAQFPPRNTLVRASSIPEGPKLVK